MPDENKKMNTKTFSSSKLTLDNRNVLNITGVEKIIGSNENRIVLVVAGSGLTIGGNDLHVSKLDVEKGFIEILGTVSEFKYSGKGDHSNLFRKIFK